MHTRGERMCVTFFTVQVLRDGCQVCVCSRGTGRVHLTVIGYHTGTGDGLDAPKSATLEQEQMVTAGDACIHKAWWHVRRSNSSSLVVGIAVGW